MSLDHWIGIGIPDDVAHQAIDWIAVMDSGSVSQDTYHKWQLWLNAEPTHQWAFEELSELWAKSQFIELNSLSSTDYLQRVPSRFSYPFYANLSLLFSVVGCALAAI